MEVPNEQTPHCPQCGEPLEHATRTTAGLALCPRCAHSVVPPDFNDFSTELYLPDEIIRTTGEDRFRLSGRLGEGGFGTVYRAFDQSLRRNVAIKVPRKTAGGFDSRQFILEARAASVLRHPNVVAVFDVGFNEGAPYIVSECIEGVSLRQWLDGPQATFDEIARVAEKLCRAIGYAHAMGVVHRDIKPSNVIVDDKNEPHVLDFGLANSRVTGEAVRFRQDVPVGTPAYMAPEQARGDLSKIERPADIYALGVVLYQMLTRKLPFVGSAERILDLVQHEEPVRPRMIDARVPVSLEAISLKAMQKDIAKRYSSADAMGEDLARYREGRPVKALGRYDKRSLVLTARRRFIAGVAATTTCGFLGSAAWLGINWYRNDPRVRVRLDGNGSQDTVTWTPYDPHNWELDPSSTVVASGADTIRLLPGLYLVSVTRGDRVGEALRTVTPSAQNAEMAASRRLSIDGAEIDIRWLSPRREPGASVLLQPEIKTYSVAEVPAEMQLIPGGTIEYRHRPGPSPLDGSRSIGPYYLQNNTVTVADVVATFGAPIFNVGAALATEARLPFPVAVEWAESNFLSLMTAWEWLFAATNGGSTALPWGDELDESLSWSELAVLDRAKDFPNVRGLFSGLGEWTSTASPPRVAPTGRKPVAISTDEVSSPLGIALPRSRAVVGAAPEAFGGRPLVPIPATRVLEFAFRPESLEPQPVGVRCVRRLGVRV